MGHWDLVGWKQKISFPPQPPPFLSPAFCSFSLFVAYLLTLPSTSPGDGKRKTADQVFTERFAEGRPYEITDIYPQDTFSGSNTQMQGWQPGEVLSLSYTHRYAGMQIHCMLKTALEQNK